MKNNSCYRPFLAKALSFIFLISFAALAARAEKMVKLHGKITNPISDSIHAQYYISNVAFEVKNYAAKVNSDGSFQLEFPVVNNFTILQIIHGNQGTDLVVAPGYDLDIKLDAKNFDSSLHYSGNGSAEANFCALHSLTRGAILDFDRATQPYCKKEPAAFEKSLDSMLQQEMNFVNDNKKGLSAGFVRFWSANFRYSSYSLMLIYPYFHEMQKQHSMKITNVPQENFVVVKDVPEAFDDNLLELPQYQVYLERLYKSRMEAAKVPNTADSLLAQAFTSKNMPPKTAEFYIAMLIYRGVKFRPVEQSLAAMERYKERYPHNEYIPVLEEQIKTIKKIVAGKQAIDFTINTIDGKTMKLSDLKGKVIMIDFWASWCMPCIAEMPHEAKLEKEYEGKDIVFLYISVDENTDNWKSAIAKHHIEGMHMLAAGGIEGPLAKQYGIQGIPAYFLIDKNGKFADMNSLRPSDGDKLKDVIDSLLK